MGRATRPPRLLPLALLLGGIISASLLWLISNRGHAAPRSDAPVQQQAAAASSQQRAGGLCDMAAYNAGEPGCHKQVLKGYPYFTPQYEPAPQLSEDAYVDEIRVFVASDHFWHHTGEWNRTTPCSHRGRPLTCRYGRDDAGISAADADAQWFHLPHLSGSASPQRAFPGQANVGMSMESSANYPQQGDAAFMANFDLHMTYRLDSQAIVAYDPFDIRTSPEADLPGFEARQPAVLYINSNCNPRNNREVIVRQLMEQHGVEVHSMGRCLHNMDEPDIPPHPGLPEYEQWTWKKHKIMQGYRVCVAMENSNVEHYLTEKAWHVLGAGCVPLYMGAPDAKKDFLPADESVLWVEDYPSTADLAAEIKRVTSDRAAWEARTAWRRRPFAQHNAGYQRLVKAFYDELPHYRCQACQVLADRKLLRLAEQGDSTATVQ